MSEARRDQGLVMAPTAQPAAAVEWVRLSGHTVIATGARRWLQPVAVGDLAAPFTEPMLGPGTAASTGNLLDGALAAAAQDAPRATVPPLTTLRWAWRIVGSYHTTSATPGLMNEAARRLAEAGQHAVATHCTEVSREEQGHDRLALRDLEALGYEAHALVAEVAHPTAQALVHHFAATVRGTKPVACLGYAYALERLASLVPRSYVEGVERLLGGMRATRCLRVHSSLGSDVRHVEQAREVIAGLPADDRIPVAQACYKTAVLVFSAPGGYASEDDLYSMLSPYRTKGVPSWPSPR